MLGSAAVAPHELDAIDAKVDGDADRDAGEGD